MGCFYRSHYDLYVDAVADPGDFSRVLTESVRELTGDSSLEDDINDAVEQIAQASGFEEARSPLVFLFDLLKRKMDPIGVNKIEERE